MRPHIVVIALVVALVLPSSTVAQNAPQVPDEIFEGSVYDLDPEARETARRAVSRVRSPYCPGLMLEVCPSAPAAALRDSMRLLAGEGYSSEEIEEWMIARHGEEWRGLPRRSGFGLWAWLLPPLALVGGAGVVVWKIRRLRGGDDHPDGDDRDDESGLSADDEARLAVALDEWKEMPE